MLGRIWRLLRDSVEVFIAADALSRGASISFYTVTSIGPVLFIVVAIASQLGGLMRRESAEMVQTVLKNASGKSCGILASVVGAITLLITASGVFASGARTQRWPAACRAAYWCVGCPLQPIHQGGRDGSSKRVEDHRSFTDQLRCRNPEGLARASKTLRGITGLHVIEQKASVSNGKVAEYRVTMELTFILEG